MEFSPLFSIVLALFAQGREKKKFMAKCLKAKHGLVRKRKFSFWVLGEVGHCLGEEQDFRIKFSISWFSLFK